MLVDWLYRTAIEISLLIGLILLVRPVVRRTLGATACYWLWSVPLVRAILVDRPERPGIIVESVGEASAGIEMYPALDSWTLSGSVSWVGIWITGLLLWGAYKSISWHRFHRKQSLRSSPLVLPERIMSAIPGRLRRRNVSFRKSDLPGSPFVTGLLRPRVFLPVDFFRRFSADEQRWVISHELAHVQRRDLWARLAWELLCTVFWFNPVVRVAGRFMRNDQELACDQGLLAHCGPNERYSYGKALLAGGNSWQGATPIASFGNQKERIAMIGRHQVSTTRSILAAALCLSFGVLALTAAPVSVAQANIDQPITLRIVEMPVKDLIRVIAMASGSNIIVSSEVDGARVSLEVTGMPARDVLDDIVNCVGARIEEIGENLYAIGPDADATAECEGVEIAAATDATAD